MVLIHRVDIADPVTSLVLRNGIIAVGTACGSVRLFGKFADQKDFCTVLLTKRSPEAIAGLLIDDEFVYAIIGDVSLKRWSLATLKYDTPLVKGCTHDEVAFAMKHSVAQCPSSLSFVAERSAEIGHRIIVMRQTGECCCTDLDTLQQKVYSDLGPLPETDCQLRGCGFDGARFVWSSLRLDGRFTLKMWSVWDSPRDIPVKLKYRKGEFGALKFMSSSAAFVLVDNMLFLWYFDNENLTVINGVPKSIHLFDCLVTATGTLVVTASKAGFISLGRIENTEDARSQPYFVPLRKCRELSYRPRFAMGLPYFIKCEVDAAKTKVDVMFNDDEGVHLESGSFYS